MWMGGFVPLGYDVKDRKLVINKAEAATVRMIFERFTKIGSATTLVRALRAEGVTGKRGKLVDKGYLYKVLNNRVYVGQAVHKGTAYPGEHKAIISQGLWDKVHGILCQSPRQRAACTRAQTPALLKGLIFRASIGSWTSSWNALKVFSADLTMVLSHWFTSSALAIRMEVEGASTVMSPCSRKRLK
jgi:hypothetical protein